jgi:AcrR family transcriptional regulator
VAETVHGERTKQAILSAGLALWPNVTARGIAKALGMTHPAVLYHFDTSAALKDAIAREAVRIGRADVIRQLIVTGHPAVAHLTTAQRQGWLAGC